MVDFNILMEELLRTILIPKNIAVTIQANLPSLYGNSFRFKQVFQNLIQNAISHNDKEQGLVDIGVHETETEYEFFIKDNGVGIAAAYHAKIFKVFTKLESNNKASGIGLSIVKKIIDFYKGRVWLESQEKVGSTFYFSIPKSDGRS
jgi:light-regulated signal transduction histidine kinase (bacteriophytochrome)